MAKIAKVSMKTQVKSYADSIYYVFKNQAQRLPQFCPQKIKDIKLLRGDGGTVGSLKLYTYVVGKAENNICDVEMNSSIKLSFIFCTQDQVILLFANDFFFG